MNKSKLDFGPGYRLTPCRYDGAMKCTPAMFDPGLTGLSLKTTTHSVDNTIFTRTNLMPNPAAHA